MKEKNKKKVSIPVFIIFIIVFLVLGWIGGYYLSDKMDELLGKDTNEPKEEQQEEVVKLTDEEVVKLHESLVTTSGGLGFYFDENISIENIPADIMLEYAIANYLDENSFTISESKAGSIGICGESSSAYYFCNIYSENGTKIDNDVTKSLTFKKEVIDQYIKEKFNTTKDFVYTERPISVKTTSIAFPLSVYYNSSNQEYYVVIPHRGGDNISVKNKFVEFNQKDDEVEILDKAIICSSSESGRSCGKYLYLKPSEDVNFKDKVLVYQAGDSAVDADKNPITNGGKYFAQSGYNFDALFEDFDSQILTFKHIFKKADDGKFYWYSSEIVNE